MPNFTKKAIIESFMKLLSETSFDNITVKDIVNDCGINRNTFYYYYKDIYGLIDEILQIEADKVVEKHKTYDLWTDGFLYASEFALQNKKAIINLHNSSKHLLLQKYLHKIVYNVIIDFAKNEAKDTKVDVKDIEFIAEFYSSALLGLLDTWIDNYMAEDYKYIIKRTGFLFKNNIAQAIDMLKS